MFKKYIKQVRRHETPIVKECVCGKELDMIFNFERDHLCRECRHKAIELYSPPEEEPEEEPEEKERVDYQNYKTDGTPLGDACAGVCSLIENGWTPSNALKHMATIKDYDADTMNKKLKIDIGLKFVVSSEDVGTDWLEQRRKKEE